MSKCEWKDRIDFWETECKKDHYFPYGDPVENKHKFCPYCGKEITLEPKQPEILTAEEWYVPKYGKGEDDLSVYYHEDHTSEEVMDGFRSGDKNGQRKLYYQGGYKELVELIEKRISLLELDGRITPLDVEIKKAFENLKNPE